MSRPSVSTILNVSCFPDNYHFILPLRGLNYPNLQNLAGKHFVTELVFPHVELSSFKITQWAIIGINSPYLSHFLPHAHQGSTVLPNRSSRMCNCPVLKPPADQQLAKILKFFRISPGSRSPDGFHRPRKHGTRNHRLRCLLLRFHPRGSYSRITWIATQCFFILQPADAPIFYAQGTSFRSQSQPLGVLVHVCSSQSFSSSTNSTHKNPIFYNFPVPYPGRIATCILLPIFPPQKLKEIGQEPEQVVTDQHTGDKELPVSLPLRSFLAPWVSGCSLCFCRSDFFALSQKPNGFGFISAWFTKLGTHSAKRCFYFNPVFPWKFFCGGKNQQLWILAQRRFRSGIVMPGFNPTGRRKKQSTKSFRLVLSFNDDIDA